jgi:3-oxoacyl-[acyl-carrier protein] reductase
MPEVLITGASQGLGLVTARRLLDSGWRVTAVQRSISQELEALTSQFAEQLRVFRCDLAETQTLEELFRQEWFAENRPLDALVNNAAIAYDDIVSNLNVTRLDQMMKVNVTAAMVLSKAVIRRMLLHRMPGSLVHVSSICAHTGYKGLAMYAASKGALESFSRTLAREWGSRGIRSNCVVPGFMETAMSQGLSQEMRDRIYRRTAMQSPTSPESVAATIEFLLSVGSRSITGQNVIVDSGTI